MADKSPGTTPGPGVRLPTIQTSVVSAVSNQSGQSSRSPRSKVKGANELATHLPDQVVYADHAKELPYQKTFQGVLMFLDISGFTALCEKYSMNPKNGTEQLTKTLNGYIEALVNEILSSDGDILKFAGDAILTLWRVDSFLKMKVTVAHVIKCALHIQKRYGEWTTGAGVKLRIKMGIASGEIVFTYLGNEEFCHYVTMGRAVDSVKAAEHFCKSGDVVLSPSGWCHCAGLPVDKEILGDNKHIKVTEMYNTDVADSYEMCRTTRVAESQANLLGAADMVVAAQRSARELGPSSTNVKVDVPKKGRRLSGKDRASFLKTGSTLNKMKGSMHTISSAIDSTFKPFKEGQGEHQIPESLVVRKAIILKTNESVNRKLRLYIAAPVIKKLEEQQPLEYLSEMRQVTIVFVNLQLHDGCSKVELCQMLQQAFDTIYNSVKRMQGCLNKVFMFDKGCTFLVIFGLPGFKHEKDCATALLCSYRMKAQLDEIEKVSLTSIGVTTGSSFCGVVGHSHRHEYTVIGRKVNMAARLMMHYPDKVTCDNDTFHHSKLHKSNFGIMEVREMKGLQNVGVIRQFTETMSCKGSLENLRVNEYECPLIGRDKEQATFMAKLQLITSDTCDPKTQPQVIVFEGESGIGKTRMLEAVTVKALESEVKVIACSLSMSDGKTPYYAVKNLLVDLFGFDYDTPHQEREHELFKLFSDPFIGENMSLLNDLLLLKLPQHQKFKCMDSKQRNKLFHELLLHIVHELAADRGVLMFTVDDAQFMDRESWEFVSSLGHDMKSLVVLTLKSGITSQLSSVARQILTQPTTVVMYLGGLHRCYMTSLACQLLGVQKIPQRLEKFLQEKSHGVPSWCSQMLKELFYDGILKTQVMNAPASESMVSPPSCYMSRKRRTSKEVELEFGAPQMSPSTAIDVCHEMFSKEDQSNPYQFVCIIAPGQSLDGGIPDSVKGMIQARIDRMEERDQLVMKTAAILGSTFSRAMVDVVLPAAMTSEELSGALTRLCQNGIFTCDTVTSSGVQSQNAECKCPQDAVTKHRLCRILRFLSSSIQETAYEMLLEKLRTDLHKKAALYLESKAHKCAACGGGGFFPEHMLDKTRESIGSGLSSKRNSVTSQEPVRRINLKKSLGPQQRVHRKFKTVSDKGQNHNLDESFTLTGMEQVGRQKRLHGGNKRRSSVVARAIQAAFKKRGSNQLNDFGEHDETEVSTVLPGRASCESVMSTETLDGLDLRECECMEILARVYPQLVRHWRAAGDVKNTVHFLMEAAAAAIAVYDNMQALSYMRDASQIMTDVNNQENPFPELSNYTPFTMGKWEEARMESLIGQSLFHMGQMDESVPHFQIALRILGKPQPTSCLGIRIRILVEGFRQWCSLRSNSVKKGAANLLSHRLTEQASCLSHMFHYHLINKQDRLALLCIVQQLNRAEEVQTDLHELLMAYSCIMELCLVKVWKSLGRRYEYKALIKCLTTDQDVTPEDLVSIAHLHCTSINMRLAWSYIADAIDSGCTANRITKKLHDNDMRMHVLPVLAQALLLANRVVDTVDILKELDFLSAEAEDIVGRSWYYAGCLDIVLEAGFQLETPISCMDFAQKAYRDPTFLSDHLPLFYLAASLALWHERRSEPNRAEAWYRIAKDNRPSSMDNYMAVRASVKLLECELVVLAYKIFHNEQQQVNLLKQTIAQSLKQLKTMCIKMPVFIPRRLHLEAYCSAICGKMKEARKKLKQCLSISMEVGNLLEMHWATHSQDVWFDPEANAVQADFWLTDSNTSMLDWHLASAVVSSVVKYSLPLPSWFDK